jgi:hypothetical protein
MVASAKAESDAATAELTTLIQQAITNGELAGLPCASNTSAELLEMLRFEFQRIPIIHNAPIYGAATVDDDSGMFQNLMNGFIQSVPHRWVFGVEPNNNMFYESWVMSTYLGFPDYSDGHITMREANDKMLYLANNWEKKHAGNFQYGTVTYVINPIYKDKFFVAPFDTGLYAQQKCPKNKCPIGSFDVQNQTVYVDHVIVAHLENYKYSIGKAFKRWYTGTGDGPLIAKGTNFVYFEVEWAGTAWLPEGLVSIYLGLISIGSSAVISPDPCIH